MKKLILWVTVLMLALGTALADEKLLNASVDPTIPWPFAEDAQLLEIWFPKIKNCDAALIRCGGKNILIDMGDEAGASMLLELLRALEVDHIDAAYNTHPHHDHLLGFTVLAREISIDRLYICFHEYYNERMRAAMKAAKYYRIPVHHYEDMDEFTVGDARLTMLLKGSLSDSVNDQSAVMHLSYGDCSMLFMADLETTGLQKLCARAPAELLSVDVIKQPHHGKTSICHSPVEEHLLLSVITGTSNVTEVEQEMIDRGIPYITTTHSWVHLVTDGKIWYA